MDRHVNRRVVTPDVVRALIPRRRKFFDLRRVFLRGHHESLCDPRLNDCQGLELVLQIAKRFRKKPNFPKDEFDLPNARISYLHAESDSDFRGANTSTGREKK